MKKHLVFESDSKNKRIIGARFRSFIITQI